MAECIIGPQHELLEVRLFTNGMMLPTGVDYVRPSAVSSDVWADMG